MQFFFDFVDFHSIPALFLGASLEDFSDSFVGSEGEWHPFGGGANQVVEFVHGSCGEMEGLFLGVKFEISGRVGALTPFFKNIFLLGFIPVYECVWECFLIKK